VLRTRCATYTVENEWILQDPLPSCLAIVRNTVRLSCCWERQPRDIMENLLLAREQHWRERFRCQADLERYVPSTLPRPNGARRSCAGIQQ